MAENFFILLPSKSLTFRLTLFDSTSTVKFDHQKQRLHEKYSNAYFESIYKVLLNADIFSYYARIYLSRIRFSR